MGWDKTSSFVQEYTDALSGLEKDQVSGLVTSSYGIHIIKCTDVYNAPKEKADDGHRNGEDHQPRPDSLRVAGDHQAVAAVSGPDHELSATG